MLGRREKQRVAALAELTELQVLQQILLTLERIEETILRSEQQQQSKPVEEKPPPGDPELDAAMIVAGINYNTEQLSKISIYSDDEAPTNGTDTPKE